MPQAICGVVICLGQKGEGLGRIVARLHLQRGPVDGAAIQPRRRAGLQPAHLQAKAIKRFGQADGGGSPVASAVLSLHPPGGNFGLADMDQAIQESAGGQHHGSRRRFLRRSPSSTPVDACRPSKSGLPRSLRGFPDRKSAQQCRLHCRAIKRAIGLGAGPAHRRALAAVEQAKLDARRIRHAAHQARPAHRSRAPDGPCPPRQWRDCRTSRPGCRERWVSSRVRAPSARRRRRRFAAGMAAADHDDVVSRSCAVANTRIAAIRAIVHFPMQKSRNTESSNSSTSTWPVMRPMARIARRKSSAKSSG